MGWACRSYYNVNPFIGACIHDTIATVPVPPFQVPAKLPHVDFGVTQGLWIGSLPSTGHDKEVRGDGLWFLGRMSDAGLGVPHISFPPTWFNVMTSLFAMSNATFGSSSVQIGCHNLLWGNDDCDMAATPFGLAGFSINLACYEPFCLPTDLVVVWGTVYCGMTWNDIWAALIDIAISMATDVLTLGLGCGLSKLGAKIGKASSSKAVKFLTGTLASEAYETYASRAVATQGIGNALAMTDDDMARFATNKSMKESAGQLDTGVETFVRQWGDQFTTNLDETWERGFKEAIEELDALKGAGLADDVARKAAAQTLLEEAFEDLALAIKQVGREELIFAILVAGLRSGVSTTLSQLVFNGNLFGSGTEGGGLSFGGLGWTEYLKRERGGAERYGEDDWISLYEDADADDWGVTAADVVDDYWYAGTTFDAMGTGGAISDDEDDYWYAPSGAAAT
jgi:hypothetical protein